MAPVVILFRRIRWKRASISSTSETRRFPISPGREGGREGGEADRARRETSDKSWGRDKKGAREQQIMIQTFIEKKDGLRFKLPFVLKRF